ncbi:GNAT family N-acetyltransferase [Chelativorans sp. ZYF759]|uniref:GNAT family N-acetyltransferase n=1 Tax=Chelativorans sp. ZYF759 TaxID=2692213 RepID=UPI00145D92E1|nr:GNAT family N-acetyltransferase [Chelativorans sp. ZYF759]NMG41276.1 GNAT family N-acetyltransferase [Chelativorans sp. ZYF759]
MVDGSAVLHADRNQTTSITAQAAASRLHGLVEPYGPEALSRYRQIADSGIAGHSQQTLWIESWMEAVPTKGLILTIFEGSDAIMALPLEVADTHSIRRARYMGGSHANGNFPACVRGANAPAAAELRQAIAAALAASRPDIDALVLERQMRSLQGMSNPLAVLAHQTSPNIALAVNLDDGFEGVLAKHNGKKRRKKHRYQSRKFEEAGGFRFMRAQTPEDVDRLFSAYAEMKAIWFRKNGLPDVFAGEEYGRFFRNLFARALQQEEPDFYLEALEVAGVVRAVSGSSRVGDRVVCEFGGIADDDMTPFSPGEFLTFESIQAACRDGNTVYDYGVGDEHYKRHWCDEEIHHFDVALPLSAKGRLYAGIKKPFTALKRQVKSSPRLNRLVRQLRGRVGREAEHKDAE